MARPKRDLKKVNLQMPRKEYDLFSMYCEAKGWTMAGIMRTWLHNYLIENQSDIVDTLRRKREAEALNESVTTGTGS